MGSPHLSPKLFVVRQAKDVTSKKHYAVQRPAASANDLSERISGP